MPASSRPLPRSLQPLRSAAALLTIALLVACGDEDPTGGPPPVSVPLSAGLYYMHSANGAPLPAEISRRFVGVVDEQILVDSSQLEVFSEGAWRQRYYLRVLHTGVLDRTDVVIDEGTWEEDGVLNAFTSTLRARTFQVGADNATRIATDEPMAFHTGAPKVLGIYRTTRPSP